MRDTYSREWVEQAKCLTEDPETFFVEGTLQNRQKLFCWTCPVRTTCLIDALDARITDGVWGGMTDRERRHLLKSSPHISSWREEVEARQMITPVTRAQRRALQQRARRSA